MADSSQSDGDEGATARVPDARYPGGFRPTTLADEWLVQTLLGIGRKTSSGRSVDPSTQADLIFQTDTLEGICRSFDERPQDQESLRSIVVLAMQSAFIIGAHSKGKDLALIMEKQRQSAGGKKGAETRRARAEAGWKSHATDLMVEIRSEFPTWARDRVAAEVTARWKLTSSDCPGVRHLTTHLAHLEDADIVPLRQK